MQLKNRRVKQTNKNSNENWKRNVYIFKLIFIFLSKLGEILL